MSSPGVRAIPHLAAVVTRTSVVTMCIAFASAAMFVWGLRSQRSEPPLPDNAGAWQWVATSPGANVYVHALSERPSAAYRRAWVAFRFFRSPVSVNADVLELWEVDCRRHLTRRVAGRPGGFESGEPARAPPPAPASAWRSDAPATIRGDVLSLVCAKPD
jgi:hypothetical protein